VSVIDTNKNQIVTSGPIANLGGGADLADTIAAVNAVLAALRDAGVISTS
jgi:hypothetical protein